MARLGSTALVAAILAGLLLLFACADDGKRGAEPDTRLFVAVWTDLPVPRGLDRVEAILSQDTESVTASRRLETFDQRQPIVLTVMLGFLRRTAPLDLLVVGRSGGLVVVERRLRFACLPAGDSAVAVTLEARCAGVACADGWTCVGGRCDRPDVSEADLARSVADLPPEPLRGLTAGRRIDGCADDTDCADDDPCTIDECVVSECSRRVVSPCHPCVVDADCAPYGDACREGFCHPGGVCLRRIRAPGTRCDNDDDPCTVQCCRELGECMTFDVCAEPDVTTGCLPE